MFLHSLSDRIHHIRSRIRQAAERADRPFSEITLVGVTKNVEAERINEAIRMGLTELGENKVQEAQAKRPHLESGVKIRHHFLGTLQTNKARKALELFNMVQSVDRPRLAHALNRLAGERGQKPDVLIEIKLSDEATKSGLPLSEAGDFIGSLDSFPHLNFRGLMTIAPFDVPEEETRNAFRSLKKIYDAHRDRFGPDPVLSMGMTDDFEIAIEEGSTMVRIGRAIFGERT